jgi:hypothetical protein
VIIPVVPFTVTKPLLLLHVPPAVLSLSIAVLPWQMVVLPRIPDGVVFTVTVVVATQPEGVV